MELDGVPQKIDEYVHSYVVLQGIGSLSCIRVYIILRNSFWGVATLDV